MAVISTSIVSQSRPLPSSVRTRLYDARRRKLFDSTVVLIHGPVAANVVSEVSELSTHGDNAPSRGVIVICSTAIVSNCRARPLGSLVVMPVRKAQEIRLRDRAFTEIRDE